MTAIPFLRPNLVTLETFEPYLRRMEQSRSYANFGPLNSELEQRLLESLFNGKGALTTVNNATTGLILAIAQMKKAGARYAVMPSFTFAATPLAAMWAGLEPYFVDVDMDTFCVSDSSLTAALKALGDQAALVVPYAAFGFPMDLAPYSRLVRSGMPVVVDAAASTGATCNGVGYGAGFSGAVVFSLHATKAFGIGEGGLVHSADQTLIGRIREAANFGFDDAKVCAFQGLNGKLPEFAAAVGLATLDAFPAKKARRMQLHAWYRESLEARGLLARGWTMQQQRGEVPFQFFPLLCPSGRSNQETAEALARQGIDIRTYFRPGCHEQPAFERFGRQPLTNTEAVSHRALSLPLWEEMTREQVITVVEALPA